MLHFLLMNFSFLSAILIDQMGYFMDCFWKCCQWKFPESSFIIYSYMVRGCDAFDFCSRFLKIENNNNFTYFLNHKLHPLQRMHMFLMASQRCFFLLTPTLWLSKKQLRVPSSDTALRWCQTPQLRAQCHRAALTSDTRLKYWVPRFPTLCPTWLPSQGFP